MLDFFSITICIKHEAFGSIRRKKTENGEITSKRFSKTIYINDVPVFVTSLNSGSKINIRCCPLKVLQGHNVFGTNSLKKLWTRMIVEVLKKLEIKLTTAQLREWLRGEFDVDEIHITHRFPVKKYSMVNKAVFHIKRYASETLLTSSLQKGTGITLRSPHGLASWLFYDKYREFCDKRTKEQKYLQAVVGDLAGHAKELLERLASKSIRAELKLGKDYLRKHNLGRGKCWSSSKAIEVFTSELSLLMFDGIPALPELPEVYAGIDNPKLRSVVILWANGEDMTGHYAPSTVRKYRKAIMDQLGIDILKDQPVLETSRIKMSEVFDVGNMLTGFPKWARRHPELALR